MLISMAMGIPIPLLWVGLSSAAGWLGFFLFFYIKRGLSVFCFVLSSLLLFLARLLWQCQGWTWLNLLSVQPV
jgi:hypothetical protein